MKKIAIIGAGLAGLSAAHKLKDVAKITVFEKSRGSGGRMSTRRNDPFIFDHGAQFFTARSDAFRTFLEPFIASGQVSRWPAAIVTMDDKGAILSDHNDETYVATPGMNALGKTLAHTLHVILQTEITAIEPDRSGWILQDKTDNQHGPYDWVVSAVPAPQAAALLPEAFASRDAINNTKMQGCFSLMLGLNTARNTTWDAAFVKDSPIGWIAWNQTKPGRVQAPSLLIQSTNDWAEHHLEEDKDAIEAKLLETATQLMNVNGPDIQHQSLHRWRYANVARPLGEPFLIDHAQRIAACGDWCVKGRVEAAFQSGNALAEVIAKGL